MAEEGGKGWGPRFDLFRCLYVMSRLYGGWERGGVGVLPMLYAGSPLCGWRYNEV